MIIRSFFRFLYSDGTSVLHCISSVRSETLKITGQSINNKPHSVFVRSANGFIVRDVCFVQLGHDLWRMNYTVAEKRFSRPLSRHMFGDIVHSLKPFSYGYLFIT